MRYLVLLIALLLWPTFASATVLDAATDVGKQVVKAGTRLRLFDGDATGTQETITIILPNIPDGGSWNFKLPPNNGVADDDLVTDGLGVTTWETPEWKRVTHDIDGFTVDTLVPATAHDVVRATGASSTNPVFAGNIDGDAEVRWFTTAGGTTFYGDGTGTYQVKLGPIASDDRIALGAGDALTIPGQAGDHASTTNGTFSYNTTSNKARVYENGAWADLVNAGGGGAPTTATYITQVAEAGLSAEQDLDSLTNGYMKKTAGGVIATQALPIPVTDGGTGITSLASGLIPYGDNVAPFSSDPGLSFIDGATSMLKVGKSGVGGELALRGSGSGTASLQAAASAGAGIVTTLPTVTTTMPAAQATATNKYLKANTSGVQSYSTIDAGDITSGTLSVDQGGTGRSSLLAEGVLLGDGISPVQMVVPGTAARVLRSNGTTWVSAVLDAGDIGTGTLPVTRGGTGNTAFTTAGIAYSDGTKLLVDAANFIYQDGGGATDSFLILKNGSRSSGYFRLNEDIDNGTSRINVHAPENLAASAEIYLPGVVTSMPVAQATATAKYLVATTAGVQSYVQPAIPDLTAGLSGDLAAVLSDETGTGKVVFDTTPTLVTPNIGAATGTSLITTAQIRTTSASLPLGYNTGAGGIVTQLTSKAQGVTVNTPTGEITTHNAALAAAAEVTFIVTCSSVTAIDCVNVSLQSGNAADQSAYALNISGVTAGSFKITIANWSVTSRSEALKINYAIIKGAIN